MFKGSPTTNPTAFMTDITHDWHGGVGDSKATNHSSSRRTRNADPFGVWNRHPRTTSSPTRNRRFRSGHHRTMGTLGDVNRTRDAHRTAVPAGASTCHAQLSIRASVRFGDEPSTLKCHPEVCTAPGQG